MFLSCTVYALYALGWRADESTRAVAGTVLRALTYTSNLDPLLNWLPDNYWLNHTWTLAVEEQFYLFWPALLALVYRLHQRFQLVVLLVIAFAFVPLRAASTSGTLSYELLRFDALFLGCTSALLPSWRAGWILQALGLIIAGKYLLVPPGWLGPWDFLICAAACLMVMHHALATQWMTNPVLVYFGRISYGIYIWHFLFLRPGLPSLIAIPISICVAHLSYYHFERWFLKPPYPPRNEFDRDGASPA